MNKTWLMYGALVFAGGMAVAGVSFWGASLYVDNKVLRAEVEKLRQEKAAYVCPALAMTPEQRKIEELRGTLGALAEAVRDAEKPVADILQSLQNIGESTRRPPVQPNDRERGQ